VQQPAQPVQQPIAQSGSKSKLPMIIGGVVAAMLIAGGGYFAYNHFVGSKEAPAQQEEVTTTTTESENPTNEPTAQPASDAKALTTAAISELKSASTAQQGIDKLNQAIAKGGKESVEALYTLAQLYGRVYSDKAVLANVEKLLPKDTKKAHELNEKAVALDNTFYPSLYELGCDYMAGDARGAVDRDIDKAKEYFTQGIKYAQQANDTQLAERFEIRLTSLE
jgi:serine/threonine-protein kinase